MNSKKRVVTLASVTWKDACLHSGYYDKAEIKRQKTMVMHTSGYLMESNREYIKVARELCDKEDGRCRDLHVIERKDVTKIEKWKIEVEE